MKQTNPDINEKLRLLKGLILDGDGVFFTGHEIRSVSASGEVLIGKMRNHIDGQGISFMRNKKIGIHVLFASGEGEPLGSIVKKLNNLPGTQAGSLTKIDLFSDELKKGGKVDSIEAWLSKQGLEWSDCAYIGDDRTDYEAILRANEMGGLTAAPANAQPFIKDIVTLRLEKEGGNGAIRELTDMVLLARNIHPGELSAA